MSAALQHTTFSEYLRQEISNGATWSSISWLAIFPTAAVAIFMMKRWSYGLYLACMTGVLYSNYTALRTYPAYYNLPLSIACVSFDLAIVGYFLLPAVRAGYFNPRLRWWETKPRYAVGLMALARGPWGKEQVKLVNVSEGGAYVRTTVSLQKGDVVELSFEAFEHKVEARGKIVHMSGGDTWGYGIQFELSHETKRQIRSMVKAAARAGVKDFRSTQLNFDDFKQWATRLMTSGKGWIPELSAAPATASAPTPTATAATANVAVQAASSSVPTSRKSRSKRKKKNHLKVVESPTSSTDGQKQDDDNKKAA